MMALLVRPAQSKHVLAPLSLLLAAADRCAGARSRPRRQSSERNTPEASMPMTTTMPTFDQRVERALQNLCAHEPGHFVVAQHFGTACHAHLWKSFDPGASPNAQEASSIRNDTAACAILRRKSEPATEPMLFRRGSRRGDRHAQQSQWRR
jgi:hypothetical protein